MKLTSHFLLLVICLVMIGCKTLPYEKLTMPFQSKEDPEENYGVPVNMAVIWTDSIYSQPGAPATRGFGGRIYFYDEEDQPIRVKGEMAIYGFDDSNKSAVSKVPDRKFVFRQSELQQHYSESDLGHSYSLWVPWEAAGGPRKMIALLPIFTTEEGKVVRGEQSINVLPGSSPKSELVDRTQLAAKPWHTNSSVAPASYQQTSQASSASSPMMRRGLTNQPAQLETSTIHVPPSLGQRLRQPQPRTDFSRRTPHSLRPQLGPPVNLSGNPPSQLGQPSEQPLAQPTEPPAAMHSMRPPNVFGQPGSIRSANHR